ncbi:unnamed protein product, partial [Owenia fusiformis]
GKSLPAYTSTVKMFQPWILGTIYTIALLPFTKQGANETESDFEKIKALIEDGNNKANEMHGEIVGLKSENEKLMSELKDMKSSMKANIMDSNCKLSEKVDSLSSCACGCEKPACPAGGAIEFDAIKYDSKIWWTKRITENYYTAGRLSSRMIKYAHEAGFKSIIAVVNFTTAVQRGDEYFPTTLDAKDISERLAGVPYGIARPLDWAQWQDINTVHSLTRIADSFPKPILVHCRSAFTSTFFLLSYLANKTRIDPSFEPRVDVNAFFEMASKQGFEYTGSPILLDIVAQVTGNSIDEVNAAQAAHIPDIPMGNQWQKYWLAKPLYKNIFIAGQVWSSNIQNLKDAGYSTIINVRKGVTENSMPSQEEVTLLNVRGKTGTYCTFEHGGRQSIKRLEDTRIDACKQNEYISKSSKVNYEAMNALEFGDAIGYNETLERQAVEAIGGMRYHLKPKGNICYTISTSKSAALCF